VNATKGEVSSLADSLKHQQHSRIWLLYKLMREQ